MSSSTVRAVFERELQAWLAVQTIAPGMAYVATINENAQPPLAPWVTLQYFADQSEPITYCTTPRVERGTTDAIVFVPAGSGVALAGALCDDLEQYIVGRDLTADGISIDGTVPAGEYSGGVPTARHHGLIVSFEYQRFT